MSTGAVTPSKTELLKRLTEAELSYRKRRAGLKVELEKARTVRNLAVAEAAAYGLSNREIAHALGVSYQRVHQIIDASR